MRLRCATTFLQHNLILLWRRLGVHLCFCSMVQWAMSHRLALQKLVL